MTLMSAPEAKERRRSTTALLLFLLFVVATYSPTLFSRRNFAGRDLLLYHLPIEKAVHDAYSRGRLPIWISEISGGRPLAANPNVGALYPLRPLLAQLPFPVAMRLFPVLHWAMAGAGVLLLLRSLGASPAAAWVGAVTYAFCGPAVTEVFYPNIQPGMAFLPWVVWAANLRSVSEGIRVLGLSLVFGLLFLAGDVFTVGIAIVCGVLWVLVEGAGRQRFRELLLFGLALLLAGLLAAPQIVAAALWVPETNRAILGMRLGESLSFSVAPLRLLELVAPYPFGPTWALEDSQIWGWPVFHGKTIGFFTTLHAGAFCVIALVAGRRWRNPGARFARILFLLSLAICVAPSFLPAGWSRYHSPLPFRFPEKFAVAMMFALAVLAGLAFDRFREFKYRPRWTLAVAAVLTVFAAAAALFPQRAGTLAVEAVEAVGSRPAASKPLEAPADQVSVAARRLAPAFAEAGFLWILAAIAVDRLPRPGRGAWISLVLLSLAPLAANRRIARTIGTELAFSSSAFARFLHREDPRGEYRTLGEPYYRGMSALAVEQWATQPEETLETWVWYGNALVNRGTVFNFDFDVGDFARVESLRRISSFAARQPVSPSFFANLALRWGIRFRDQDPIPGYAPVSGPISLRRNVLHHWDVLPGALPDIRLAERWREEPRPIDAARAVLGLSLGEIVIETGRRREGRARGGRIRVLQREPERLAIESEAPDPTWLFVLRGFWQYRTVLVDGHPADCVPAQLAFSAVPLPAGRHRIEWRENLPGGHVSRWGPVLFVVLMGVLLVRDSRSRRGERSAEKPTVEGRRVR
jgi:hypothetical protein